MANSDKGSAKDIIIEPPKWMVESEEVLWRPIPEFMQYEASTSGLIRRNGKILKPTKDANKYLKVNLHKERMSFCFRVNRLIVMAFIGKRPDLHVDHKIMERDDIRLKNLR